MGGGSVTDLCDECEENPADQFGECSETGCRWQACNACIRDAKDHAAEREADRNAAWAEQMCRAFGDEP